MDVANAVEILNYSTLLKLENDKIKAENAKLRKALRLLAESCDSDDFDSSDDLIEYYLGEPLAEVEEKND